MTFDDGPNSLTNHHIDFFKRKNIKVTFFFLASRLNNPKLRSIVKRAYKDGHQIANHNIFHIDIEQKLANASEYEIIKYIKKSTNIFKKNIGVYPKYFRPPYGNINDRISEILTKSGFKVVLWNLDTKDWYWEKEGRDKLKIVETFKKELLGSNVEKSYISLQHEKSKNLEAELERLNYIIDLIQMKKYKLVTLAECMNDCSKGYFTKAEWKLK